MKQETILTISPYGKVTIPVDADKRLAARIARVLGDKRAAEACLSECGQKPHVGKPMCG